MKRECSLTNGCNERRRRSFWAGVVLGCILWLAGPLAGAQETSRAGQTIQVDVNRVSVGVVVTDAGGKFVEGLQRDNFHIFDNGEERAITEFATVEAPAQVLLLVEAGPSVYFLKDVHLVAADGLLKGLSTDDRVAITWYAEAPRTILNFTTEKNAAQRALEEIRFNLGFGELNLAASLNAVMDWLASVPGKKTVVLVSTGVDTSLAEVQNALLGRLRTGDVRVLGVSISGPMRAAPKEKKNKKQPVRVAQGGFDEADAWLKAIAEATGGRAFFPENAKAFEETYKQVAEIVRHEYSLAFAPIWRGRWRSSWWICPPIGIAGAR